MLAILRSLLWGRGAPVPAIQVNVAASSSLLHNVAASVDEIYAASGVCNPIYNVTVG
jgi:hypothetical protein